MKTYLKVGIVLTLVFCIGAAAWWSTMTLVERAVARDAGRRSVEWAEYAIERLPRIQALAEGAHPTSDEWALIEEMASFGGLFRFKIFSPEGVLQFESDDRTTTGASLGEHNATAASVVATGQPFTLVADGRAKPNRPDLYSETYLPVYEGERLVAIAETYFDQTEKTAAVRAEYALFGTVMIGLILAALALPSTGLLILFRRLRKKNSELDRERVRALDADRVKTEFLATVSHELRTPMNGIIGAVQLLEYAELPDEEVELVDIIRTCSEGQMELIEELLAFGEIEAGAVNLHEELVDPAACVRSAIRMSAVAAESKGLAFNIHAPENENFVLIDPKRLRQVVVNLVGNAVKFTDEGGVDVAVRVDQSNDQNGATLHIAVSDTGPGIAQDQHARIFQRFTQADSSTTRKAGGNGLGLAIARAIVREMGGEIALKSAPDEGSIFTIIVPVKQIEATSNEDETDRKAA